jgi:acyl-CoA hydrolase
MKTNRFLYCLFFISSFVVLSGCENKIENRGSQGSTIVCFGDSLTAGSGADEGKDYPSVLRSKVSLPVINAGYPGDTTGDALKRLESDVFTQDPKIVIVTLGANDFLRQVSMRETWKNVEAIVDKIQAHGAMVVWAEVQIGFWGDSYLHDFKKMARQKHFVLIPNILKGIMFDPSLKYDQIHPNSKGYQIMAERIYKRIEPLLK